ncbi:uncharacterized protein LOC144477734, partial [Augochlora pura]
MTSLAPSTSMVTPPDHGTARAPRRRRAGKGGGIMEVEMVAGQTRSGSEVGPNKIRKRTKGRMNRRGGLGHKGDRTVHPPGCTRLWRVLQINLNGCRMAQELMTQTAVELGVDMVVISEPWKILPHWYSDSTGKAAMWVTDRGIRANMKISSVGYREGAVAVELDDSIVVSCYYSPNIPFKEFEERLEELQELLTECELDRTLVMGDFNAKSPAWGSNKGDKRGVATIEMAGSCGLVPLISEGEYSFERNGRYSLIDIALSGKLTLARWAGSRILDVDSASDHFYRIHEFGSTTVRRDKADYRADKRVDTKKFKKTYLQAAEYANPMIVATREDIDAYVEHIEELVEAASVDPHPTTTFRHPVWWWNQEIAVARKTVVAARRRTQRARATGRMMTIMTRQAAYKALRRDLKTLIIQAKRAAWGKMIDGVGADVWGKPYKWVLGTIN